MSAQPLNTGKGKHWRMQKLCNGTEGTFPTAKCLGGGGGRLSLANFVLQSLTFRTTLKAILTEQLDTLVKSPASVISFRCLVS